MKNKKRKAIKLLLLKEILYFEKSIIWLFNKGKKKYFLAFIFTMLSKLTKDKFNKIEYNEYQDIFLHKRKNRLLYADYRPEWNISYKRLRKKIFQFYCIYYLPKKNDIVIELGAGVGTETFQFLNLVGNEGKVIAVEAHPYTFNTLQVLKTLKIQSFTPVNAAITSENKTVYISNKANHATNSIKNDGEMKVAGITFDKLVNDYNLEKINYLKVNIEGAELEMIKGMQKSINKIENFAISCHDFLFDYKTNIKNVIIEYFKKNGFIVYTIKTGHPVKDSWVFGRKIH